MKPETTLEIDGRQVAITRPGKILFPDDRITKADLINYYQLIAPHLLPYLEDRPLVLQRFPDGISEPGFIQKAVPAYYPSGIRTVTVEKAGGSVKHVVCEDAATLVYLANQACITLHPWLSRAGNLNRPDQMILDFDPSRDGDLASVVSGALLLKDSLDSMGLAGYVRATGSRGLHVVVPLDGKKDFDEVRAFARRLAETIVDRDSGRYTLEQSKTKRRGRVFIDVNRNGYAQTAVACYAVRARRGAPVCVSIDWTELSKKSFRPDAYNIRNVFDRVHKPKERVYAGKQN